MPNETKRILIKEASSDLERSSLFSGRIINVRKLGGVTFIILEDRSGIVQTVWEKDTSAKSGDIVEIIGTVKKDDRAVGGFEIKGEELKVISEIKIDMPYDPSKKELDLHLSTLLDNRVLTVRHQKVKAIFKLYNIVLKAYEEVMRQEGFTEIKTPKILGSPTEGGSNFFKIKYFDKEAYLAQSPQFYKQIMVGALERVFEIGPVFRAEPHFTTRHINEYISLDAEMGFIKSDEDVRNELTLVFKKMFEIIKKEAKESLDFFA